MTSNVETQIAQVLKTRLGGSEEEVESLARFVKKVLASETIKLCGKDYKVVSRM